MPGGFAPIATAIGFDNSSNGFTADTVQAAIEEVSAAGGVDGGVNVGASGAGVFKDRVALDLRFRKIVAGANVVVTENADTITVEASGGGGGSSFNYMPGGWV